MQQKSESKRLRCHPKSESLYSMGRLGKVSKRTGGGITGTRM